MTYVHIHVWAPEICAVVDCLYIHVKHTRTYTQYWYIHAHIHSIGTYTHIYTVSVHTRTYTQYRQLSVHTQDNSNQWSEIVAVKWWIAWKKWRTLTPKTVYPGHTDIPHTEVHVHEQPPNQMQRSSPILLLLLLLLSTTKFTSIPTASGELILLLLPPKGAHKHQRQSWFSPSFHSIPLHSILLQTNLQMCFLTSSIIWNNYCGVEILRCKNLSFHLHIHIHVHVVILSKEAKLETCKIFRGGGYLACNIIFSWGVRLWLGGPILTSPEWYPPHLHTSRR